MMIGGTVAAAISRPGLMRSWEDRSTRWWTKRPKCRSRAGTSPGSMVAPRRSALRGATSACSAQARRRDCCAGHPDRRWRGARWRRRRELPTDAGRHRGVAAQRREGDRAAASARSRRRRRPRGAAAAIRRRRVRPGDQSPPGHRPLVGDRPGARSRRHVLRAARRQRHQR